MSTPASSLTPSIVRTLVPVVVGAALTAALKTGVEVSEGLVTQVVTVALTVGYYAVVRFVEDKHPQFGWLLGLAKAPAYSPKDPPQPAPELEDDGAAGPEPEQTDNRPRAEDGPQIAHDGDDWTGGEMR